MKESAASRRQFLIASASGLGSTWVALRWPAIVAAANHARQAAESELPVAYEFFSGPQAAEVEAIAAQIIPSDGTAGAREAGVIHFIDRALTSFERDKQTIYSQGLSELGAKVESMVAGKKRLVDLTSEQQTQLLRAIEQTEFFEQVRIHTVMGFLARPDYGGNQGEAGWKLIGFEERMSYEPPFGFYDAEFQKNKS